MEFGAVMVDTGPFPRTESWTADPELREDRWTDRWTENARHVMNERRGKPDTCVEYDPNPE